MLNRQSRYAIISLHAPGEKPILPNSSSERNEILNKRLIALLLVTFLLLSVTACGGKDTPSNDTPTGTVPAATTTEEAPETTEVSLMPPIDKTDFKGAKFNILMAKNSRLGKVYGAEEHTGEVMNDASYKRDMWVEEYLSIDITYKSHTEMSLVTPVQNDVMANDGAYNLAITHPMHGLGAMAVRGYLTDWQMIQAVDITKPYWNAECNDSLEINGKQFYAFSDIVLSDVFCVYFNKDSRVKVELGLCKGKKLYDKRKSDARRDAAREMDRTLKNN